MKFRWDNRYLHWGVTAFLVIAASMLFYYGIFHMKTLIVGIKTFWELWRYYLWCNPCLYSQSADQSL